MADNAIKNKSKLFALRIVRLYQYLCADKKELILSKQLLRSGTSIGANVAEAVHAMSRKEFVAKMNISFKKAAESEYWLKLLYDSNYLSRAEFQNFMMTVLK